MNGCAPLNKMKTRHVEVGISLLLLFLLNFGNNSIVSNVSATEAQPTITEIFADRIEVISPNSIYFTIYVTTSGIPVSSGQVTVYEETDSVYAVTEEIYNGMAIVQWTPKVWTPTGWCTFIGSYEGTSEYEASAGSTEVSVNDPISTGTTPTQTLVSPSTTLLSTNEIIEFDVTVNIIDPMFPLFSGGYITLTDLTEGLVLQHHNIEDLMDSTYLMTFTQTIPALFQNGTHTFKIQYSGSYDVDHASSSTTVNIIILNNYTAPISENYTLSMEANTTVITRGVDILGITVSIEGDDPTGKILQLSSSQDNGSITTLLDEVTVTSPDYSYNYDPNETAIEGPITFILNLLDPITYEIKASANVSAEIVDPITVYDSFIFLEEEIYEIIIGNSLNIPVTITSSSGSPITDDHLFCEIKQNASVLQELISPISNGQAEFEVFTGTFNVGIFDLQFFYLGNATQTTATETAELHIIKTTAVFESSIDATTIEYGTTTSWNARVTTQSGNGIANVPISFKTSLTGFYWDEWGTIMTNKSGYATIDITWLVENQVHYGNPGNYQVKIAIAPNDNVYTDYDVHRLTVIKNQIHLSLDELTIGHLGSGIIHGVLTTSTGIPIANAEIDLYWNCTTYNRWTKISTVLTDSYGNYFQEVTVTRPPATYGIEADYDGNTYYISYIQTAILEVIDNPSEVEKIEITPAILDLGDTIQINVTATDIDTISSITAFMYYNSINFTIPLQNIDNTYQTTIWCNTDYEIGTWIIDLTITDNLNIKTTFINAGQFIIATNPAPIVDYIVTPTTIPDGATVNFEISASDTLGIKSVQIEIDSIIYDITENTTIITDRAIDTLNLDALHKTCCKYYIAARAREASVFYFTYSPITAGMIPYIIYVTDNAGQIKEINGTFMVEAIAPELSVLSISTLNGTAPFPFALKLNAADGSGIKFIHIYINGEEYNLEFSDIDDSYNYYVLLSAGSYIITLTAEDIVGAQAILDIGTVNIEPADFSVIYASENLFDGETTTFTLEASTTLAFSNVTITHNNMEMIYNLDVNGILTGQLQFNEPRTYTVYFSIIDSLGTQLEHEYSFNVTAKGPVIESIYPNSVLLTTMTTPMDLNLEAIVKDASGVASVKLCINETEYLLSNTLNLWYTTVSLERGNYTLTIVATDIYGAETTYILGELTVNGITTTSTEESTNTPKESTENTQTTTDLITTVGMIGVSLVTVVGTVLVKWKKRF